MNYLTYLLGLALAGALLTGSLYRNDAQDWKTKYNDRVNQEQTAAQQAKDDAAAQEKKDLAALQSQSSQALSQAQDAKDKADKERESYEKRLKEASGEKDLGHACSGVVIPGDLIP